MDAHKLQLKIFLTPDSGRAVALESFVPVFHRWIKERLLPELVIDVANYAHVPQGPGVVLIGHGSDYSLDEGEGRRGLIHSRKRAGAAPAARLEDLARRTFHAASLLERDPTLAGKVRVTTNEILLRINDRLAAPNSDATFASVAPELAAFGRRLFGDTFDLGRVGGPKDLFAVRFTSGPAAPTLAALLERAGGPPGADASLIT